MKNQRTYAITSQPLENAIGKELRNRRETYYIFYRISIETGIPAVWLVDYKVSDIKNKKSITITSRRPQHSEKHIEASMSDALLNDIAHFIEDRDDEEYLFVGMNNLKIQTTTINKALINAAHRCGVSNVTILSLKKTYIWHELLRTNDINYIRRLTRLNSNREVYEYLGLEYYPENNTSTEHILDNIYNTSLLQDTFSRLQAVITCIWNAKNNRTITEEQSECINRFNNNINREIDAFLNLFYKS